MRRNDVASTSFRHHVTTRFLINQCQIITFLILKSDSIETSRIELKGIVLPKLKLHLLLFYPSTWYICDFSCSTQTLKENMGEVLWGERVCWSPSQITGGLPPPTHPPPRHPSSYAYVIRDDLTETRYCDLWVSNNTTEISEQKKHQLNPE